MLHVDYVLNGYHGYIHRGYVVNGVAYQTGLVKQAFRVSHVVTYLYTPGEKENFTCPRYNRNRLSIIQKSVCRCDFVSVLTDSQTVIPPIVRALIKFQIMIIRDHFRVRRRADGPRAEIDQHHQQYRHHPLQQLLVGQLDFVSALYPIRKRDSANKNLIFASANSLGIKLKIEGDQVLFIKVQCLLISIFFSRKNQWTIFRNHKNLLFFVAHILFITT